MRPIIVGFRLSVVEKTLLDRAAERMGCPVSDAIRWALRRELAAPQAKQTEGENRQHGMGK
jgi:predicted kinase